jgi:hypothetical protein
MINCSIPDKDKHFKANLQNCVRNVCLSACKILAPTRRIFMKIDIWGFLENLARKFSFVYILTRITGTLNEHPYELMIKSSFFNEKYFRQSCRERTRSLTKINLLSGRASRQSYRVCLWRPMVTGRELLGGFLTVLLLLNQIPSTMVFCLLSLWSESLKYCLPYCPYQISFRPGQSLLRCR